MLWILFYVSIMLGVWGYYLFRDEKNKAAQNQQTANQAATQPAVKESQFDRIRRMRELDVAEKPQYLLAREQATLTIPDHLIESIQGDVISSFNRVVTFLNRDRDRYIWLVMTLVVVTLFISTAYKHTENSSVPMATDTGHSWTQLQPVKTALLSDADVEKQVSSKDAFKVIFADFPKDKARFIHEFTSVLSRGEEAQRDKWQEMYLVMEQYHLHKYISEASDESVLKYAHARFDVLRTLFSQNKQACQEYLASPRDNFVKARDITGRDMFAEMIKAIPAMVSSSRSTPQSSPSSSAAGEIKRVINNRVQYNNYSYIAGDSDCGRQLAYYDEVLKLPAVEASTVLRFDLSK